MVAACSSRLDLAARAAEADRARIFAIKRQPPLRGDWSLAAGLNGGTVRGERPPSAKARHRLQPIFKRVSLFESRLSSAPMLGYISGWLLIVAGTSIQSE